MNRGQAKLLAPIIAAYGEGKTIQIKTGTDGWFDVSDVLFNLTPDNYRIKPSPEVVYVVFDISNRVRNCVKSESNAKRMAAFLPMASYKKFIEAVE